MTSCECTTKKIALTAFSLMVLIDCIYFSNKLLTHNHIKIDDQNRPKSMVLSAYGDKDTIVPAAPYVPALVLLGPPKAGLICFAINDTTNMYFHNKQNYNKQELELL